MIFTFFRGLRLFRAFASDPRGSTAVEFALVSAPFFALLLASIQTALVYFCGQCLETAAEKSGRLLLTGYAQTNTLSQQQYLALVCARLPSLLSCSNVMIDVQSYSSFSSAVTSAPTVKFAKNGSVSNVWSFSPGNPGDIVVLRVMYQMPVIGGPLNFTLSNLSNGNHLLLATAVFKNEQYQ
ncbi:TadE/TadG family type IV pilus assembly protein [Beijerinckia sp. L45]|uniref:TadE/TadG family type IV pilus assembly protein n=1 Tax=Beijerinckia sp. L45 TaxID=1641855 RepID=UPI00131DEBBA|nr:TadE/TadG family type IV pilus assembly protein [Beijerinckia sp. L45]